MDLYVNLNLCFKCQESLIHTNSTVTPFLSLTSWRATHLQLLQMFGSKTQKIPCRKKIIYILQFSTIPLLPQYQTNTIFWSENCVHTNNCRGGWCLHSEHSQMNMYLLHKIARVLVLGVVLVWGAPSLHGDATCTKSSFSINLLERELIHCWYH